MSQPHDGHRTFFPSGNPFRMIFPKGFYLSPKLIVVLNSFEQKLAESLKKLKPEDISDIWSLSWLSQAVNFLSEAHDSVKTLITDLELPVSNWDDKWIDAYLDNSVKLLDICIALSSELSRLDQGQVLLQYVLHQLGLPGDEPSHEKIKQVQTTLSDWRQVIESRSPKLDGCCLALQGLAGTLHSEKVKNSSKGKVLGRALYAIKVVTIFVCSVFTSALCGCSKPLITLIVADKFLWADAFNDLQADVSKSIITGQVIVLKELGAVEKCVERLCPCNNETQMAESGDDQIESGRGSVAELAEVSEMLSAGLDHLSRRVGDFFQIVMEGRNALLCNIGGSDGAPMEDVVSGDELFGL